MQEEIKVWLSDILNAIEEINSFLPSERIFADFQEDLKTKRAVERNIGIIGEAMNRILKASPEITISHSRRIVDTRNRIIHDDSVSDDVLWSIIIRHLPLLQNEILDLLDN